MWYNYTQMGTTNPKIEAPAAVFESGELTEEERQASLDAQKERRKKMTMEIVRLKEEGAKADLVAREQALDHDLIKERSEELLKVWTEDGQEHDLSDAQAVVEVSGELKELQDSGENFISEEEADTIKDQIIQAEDEDIVSSEELGEVKDVSGEPKTAGPEYVPSGDSDGGGGEGSEPPPPEGPEQSPENTAEQAREKARLFAGALDDILETAAQWPQTKKEKKQRRKLSRWLGKKSKDKKWPLDDSVTQENYQTLLQEAGVAPEVVALVNPHNIGTGESAYAFMSRELSRVKAEARALERVEDSAIVDGGQIEQPPIDETGETDTIEGPDQEQERLSLLEELWKLHGIEGDPDMHVGHIKVGEHVFVKSEDSGELPGILMHVSEDGQKAAIAMPDGTKRIVSSEDLLAWNPGGATETGGSEGLEGDTQPDIPVVEGGGDTEPDMPAVEEGGLEENEDLSQEEIERLKKVEESAERLLTKLETGGLDSFDKQSLELLNKVLSDENKGGALAKVRQKLTAGLQYAGEKVGDTAAGWYVGVPVGAEIGRAWAENKAAAWIQEMITAEGGGKFADLINFFSESGPVQAIVEKAAKAAGGVGGMGGSVLGFAGAGSLYGGAMGFVKEWRAARGFGRVKKFMEKARLYEQQQQEKEEYKEEKRAEVAGEETDFDGWFKRKGKAVSEAFKRAYREEAKAEELAEVRAEVEQGRDPRLELLAMQKALLESPDELSLDLNNDEWVKFVGAARDAKISLIREKMRVPEGGMLSPETVAEMEGNAEVIEKFLSDQEKLAKADADAAAALLAKFETDIQKDIDMASTELEDYSTVSSKVRRYGGSVLGGAWRGTHIPAAIKTVRVLVKAGVFIFSGGTSAVAKRV